MAAFFLAFGLIYLLQWSHARFLHREFPRLKRSWIRVGLILLHLPLIAYFVLRLTGHGSPWIHEVLRPVARMGFYFQALTLVHLASALVGHLAWKLWRRYRKRQGLPENPSRRAFLRTTAALGAGVGLATSLAGAARAYGDPEVTRLDIPFPDLPPGLEGLRLAHLSDLHAGPLVSDELLLRWRALLDRERPDLVLITGDLVDSRPDEILPVMGALQGLRAPLGVHAVLGNHDYFRDPQPIWDSLAALGIGCLENRGVVLDWRGTSFALVGLQDPMARNGRFQGLRFGPGPDPREARKDIPPGIFTLALQHRPALWPLAREAGAHLTLSGHTHGGQINPPGLNLARLLGPYAAGLYREGNDTLYVSRGLGVVGLPMRLNAPPELPILRLVRE